MVVGVIVVRFIGIGVGVDIVIIYRFMFIRVWGVFIDIVLVMVVIKFRRIDIGVVSDFIVVCFFVLIGRGFIVVDVGFVETISVVFGIYVFVRVIRVDIGIFRMILSGFVFVIVFIVVAIYRLKVKYDKMVKVYIRIILNFLFIDLWSDYKWVSEFISKFLRIVVGEVCEVCGGWVCSIVMIGVGIVGV